MKSCLGYYYRIHVINIFCNRPIKTQKYVIAAKRVGLSLCWPLVYIRRTFSQQYQ